MRPGVAGALMGVILGGMASLVLAPPRSPSPSAEGTPQVGAAPEPREEPRPLERTARAEPAPESGRISLSPERTPSEPSLRPIPLPGGTLLWQREPGFRPGAASAPDLEVRVPEPALEPAPTPTLTPH